MSQQWMRYRQLAWASGVALVLAACATPPELAARAADPVGPTPPILPIDDLLAQGAAPADGADPAASLAARAARLRARAAALQGPATAPDN
jgi:hypothetical protein